MRTIGPADAPLVAVSRTLLGRANATLQQAPIRTRSREGFDSPPSRAELLALVSGATAVITSITERADEELMDAAGPALRGICNIAVGVDNIDLQAALRRGIAVTNTPGVLTDATAELTLGLLIVAGRRILEGNALMKNGVPWTWSADFLVGARITGSKLGIVGYGRIGRAVAQRARAIGMVVSATGGHALIERCVEDGVVPTTLDDILESSDYISLHCPLTPSTYHLIGEEALSAMKQSAIIVNMARGGVVDETALARAIRQGSIGGAALDVHEDEPLAHPDLLGLPSVVLTPHLGSADFLTREAMCLLAAENAVSLALGEQPHTPVKE